MAELSEEAKAELQAAIRIVNSDRTHRLNRDDLRAMLREEMSAWKPPTPEPPAPPKNDPPTPPTPPAPPGPPPPPPAPPAPPTPPVEKPKRRGGYWPQFEDD